MKFNLASILFSILIILGVTKAFAQDKTIIPPPFKGQGSEWVDARFQSMTLDEKIAQLIMIPAYSNKDQVHVDSISRLVEKYQVGGIIFFQGGPVRQAIMTNKLQEKAKIPLMISIDGEWGLGMRLDSTMSFPYQMSLGGIADESLIYQMGKEIALQCRRVGVHVNFAPVVDINNNVNNPVIGYRSFGEQKENVASKAMAYMKGMQDNKVLANAKHFPGHGDTNVDSHYGLPVIHFSKIRMEDTELYPFKRLFDEGLGSVMVAHMNVPAYDSTHNLASTLSKPIVTDLLKNDLNYEGLVFTDALNMQGVAKFYEPGEVDMKALLAGNDMLLNTMNVERTISEIKKAIERNEITIEEIEHRVKKVLEAKYWLGLDKYEPVELKSLYEDLNNPQAQSLNKKLTEASITLLRNKEDIIPIKNLGKQKIAALAIGTAEETSFQKGLGRFAEVDHFFISHNASIEEFQSLMKELEDYSLVIAGVHKLQMRAGASRFGVTSETKFFLKKLMEQKPTIVSVFGNVYSLAEFDQLARAHAVMATYQESENAQNIASQIIFGALGAKGKLPVTVNADFKVGDGLQTSGGLRLGYSFPEEFGMDSRDFEAIETLVKEAITSKAIPGAQVLIAKSGKVIFHESFGTHTYESNVKVENEHLYDLASVTKISTSLAALMKLKCEGKFDENGTFGEYLPMARGTSKENIKYVDILTHQAGLQAWIPFWKETVRKNGKFKWNTFKYSESKRFPVLAAQDLYIHKNYKNKIYRQILDSPLGEKGKYVYSDLSFILAPEVVKAISGQDFEEYLQENIYSHIGAKSLTFNPYLKYDLDQIVPTEYDSLFRKQLLHGTIHDEGAAMLGGVSGHAGLFGNAHDLAKLMQLYLNDGVYADEVIIGNNVVGEFSKCKFCDEGNYRALGFDRPRTPGSENGNAAKDAPASSFGHTGFTGTYAWVDPENELVYIFLSNRVNPTRENSKLSQLGTRTKVMQVAYDALSKSGQLQ
ncbi:glycoside hydrolase family 3 N-terminal domain-containing protein [Belliella kenyensis]|uniref:beta-N-acetylhexosaminidase n=1 Tax=Belliella kenyensis TaxID=1472724 RepID=A0ABV8EJJ2_9BACT|nr:glycoside hydrolase family 3 N-terminal domain-containing protein [Belliella kenyensis]MCH7401325.1 serine hydrolase [Belliella kenyensis]MDN3602769.1 glycoside hydrolase family 3 N-terminal domain-containing protein [Belliella kenyensis]